MWYVSCMAWEHSVCIHGQKSRLRIWDENHSWAHPRKYYISTSACTLKEVGMTNELHEYDGCLTCDERLDLLLGAAIEVIKKRIAMDRSGHWERTESVSERECECG